MPTTSCRQSREVETITLANFLSLGPGEVANTEASPATRIAARIFPPSIRNRTVSGFRRARKLTLHNKGSDGSSQRPDQHCSTIADQRCTPRPSTATISTKAPQVDSLPFELCEKQDLLMEGGNQKDSNDIWFKWLQVSNNLTPVIGIGSSRPSPGVPSKRLCKLARQSWRPSTAVVSVSGSVAWPLRPMTAQCGEESSGKLKARSSIHLKRPRTTMTEREQPKQQSLEKKLSQSYVADPATGGKVTLRTLTLLSRPVSREGFKCEIDQAKILPALPLLSHSPVPSPPLTPPPSPPPSLCLEEPIRRSHKRIKSQQVPLNDARSSYLYYSLSFDVSNDLYPISERPSVESSGMDRMKEQGRPDSPTIPLILLEANLVKCSQDFMRGIKLQTENAIPTLKVPMHSDIPASKRSWTERFKRAISHKDGPRHP